MPLTVTDQAAATLKELLVSQRQEPDQVLRLVSYGEGSHGFQLDTPQPENYPESYLKANRNSIAAGNRPTRQPSIGRDAG
jgi:Fe-S cluster assembly iron-binding protein IscA